MQQLLEDQERTTREAAEVQDEDGAVAEERASRLVCNVADNEVTRHPMTWQRGERRRADEEDQGGGRRAQPGDADREGGLVRGHVARGRQAAHQGARGRHGQRRAQR